MSSSAGVANLIPHRTHQYVLTYVLVSSCGMAQLPYARDMAHAQRELARTAMPRGRRRHFEHVSQQTQDSVESTSTSVARGASCLAASVKAFSMALSGRALAAAFLRGAAAAAAFFGGGPLGAGEGRFFVDFFGTSAAPSGDTGANNQDGASASASALTGCAAGLRVGGILGFGGFGCGLAGLSFDGGLFAPAAAGPGGGAGGGARSRSGRCGCGGGHVCGARASCGGGGGGGGKSVPKMAWTGMDLPMRARCFGAQRSDAASRRKRAFGSVFQPRASTSSSWC
mmetsp:Transcript_10207/g.36101  ORF Transcript_10207/g.36101 Transcript_10207/m.36101 type:complete len:284 (-) Transcript_10207:217-1068(-)